MNEQLETVVENELPEIDTEELILNQRFSTEGYNVAIFYTKKTPEVKTEEEATEDGTEKAPKERYITIKITNEKTGITVELERIKMVSEEEMGITPGDEALASDSGIDVLDVDKAMEAVDLYLYQQRHQSIDRDLSTLPLAA